MNLPTEEKLFEHKCRFADMSVSSYNPETINYYCNVCGGKLSIKRTEKAEKHIKKRGTMKLSKRLFELATKPVAEVNEP